MRGELEAYRIIVHSYQPIALRTAYVITGSAEDAEEVVQDAFVKAFKALPRFRLGEPLRPWLLTIVGNEARNRRRARASRPPLITSDDRQRSGDVAPSPDATVLAADERRVLGAALRLLSERDRQVIACRYFIDLAEADTSAVLGIPPGTVKSRLSRALTRLREVLDTND